MTGFGLAVAAVAVLAVLVLLKPPLPSWLPGPVLNAFAAVEKAPAPVPVGPIASLLHDVGRGDPDRHPLGSAPAELFSSTASIAADPDLAYTPGKMFLGLVGATVSEPDKKGIRHTTGGVKIGIADNMHMVTVAGSRAGKGRSVIVPNMCLYAGSVLATDPKGELATMTARRRAEGLGQRVHVLDPFKRTKGKAVDYRKRFNPIRAMRDDRLIQDAALMSDALVVRESGDSSGPHWDDNARSFIEGGILLLRTNPDLQHMATLPGLRRLMTHGLPQPGKLNPETGEVGEPGPTSMKGLEAAMAEPAALEPEINKGNAQMLQAGLVIEAAGVDFFSRPDREKGGVLSTVRRHLKFLDYPEIAESLSGHDFELEELKETPTTIYLCLPAGMLGTCARWLRLFVNLTLQAMETKLGPGPNGLPVLFCLDEFASLGHMQQLETAAGQIAGYGVKLWVILQDLGQLEALYNKRWETFFGNAGVLQFFGNNDLRTLEWIEQRCGSISIRVREDRAVTGHASDAGESGVSWKSEPHKLIALGEAARLFGRYDPHMRQLIIWAGQSPLVLQRVHYDTHEDFMRLVDSE